MTVTLKKGGNVSLTKEAPALTAVSIGLGWDVRTTTGVAHDLDASAIICGADKKALSDLHFVFYNNLESPDGLVSHTGDNRTGEGEGDDESIEVRLSSLGPDVQSIVFPVSIHDADRLGQNFGQIKGAFIRVVDLTTGQELTRYDLTEDYSTETAMVFGELYRHVSPIARKPEWKFRAIGQGYSTGLAGIAADYGISTS